jgi:putative hydrolase of the HAD superfamily
MKEKIVLFDLDDTLYKEIDYLKSAYHEISCVLQNKFGILDAYDFMINSYIKGDNVFLATNNYFQLDISVSEYLNIYRNHKPLISLSESDSKTLNFLKSEANILGIISDGRSITQNNKIDSLKLRELIDRENIVISEVFGSEKPNIANYQFFVDKYPNCSYFYIADNPQKDFITPNLLGWTTICLLDDGRNIHNQDFNIDVSYIPQIRILSLNDLLSII